MEGHIILSKRELHRAKVLEQVVNARISLKEAAHLMKVSYRQAKRLKARYVDADISGLAHRNRGRPAPNAMGREHIQRILLLAHEKYPDFNDTHLTEKLLENEGIVISRESVRKLLRAAGKTAKRKHRGRIHRSRRPAKPLPGMLVQWDGSPHAWFGPLRPPCCLMAAVDDCTSDLLAALFVGAESSQGYLRLLQQMLTLHGIPMAIYHDRHSSLVRTDDYWSLQEQLAGVQYPTHVGRVLHELGIESIPANSPQAKGRIERRFGVLQDRLIAEMRLQGIDSPQAANPWLLEYFIPNYNKRFAKVPTDPGSCFVPISAKDIFHCVCFAYEAVAANDNAVRLGGMIIDIPKSKNVRSCAGKNVLVRQHLDGSWTVWLNNQLIASHPATDLKEPIRSWKRRPHCKTNDIFQVYIASKPAPLPKGTFSLCS